ncbi:hypothetical protein RhiirA4_462558 [Rhizophagus irregularis]|uniref:Uncharacterized protein n=1 Tax=Rhizophagus irregularis TaxID=588596 RepID=A0A2I1GL76_9GLOM|nr:hypothetical protein RhiirA4_462558 [Rhizophagus irregularis]
MRKKNIDWSDLDLWKVDITENEEHLLEKVEENNIKNILSGEMMKPDYMVKEKRNLNDSDDRKRPGLQAGCMKQLTTTLNLGNSLLNGKFCFLYGHRQSTKTTTAYAIENWLKTNYNKEVYILNFNNGIEIKMDLRNSGGLYRQFHFSIVKSSLLSLKFAASSMNDFYNST